MDSKSTSLQLNDKRSRWKLAHKEVKIHGLNPKRDVSVSPKQPQWLYSDINKVHDTSQHISKKVQRLQYYSAFVHLLIFIVPTLMFSLFLPSSHRALSHSPSNNGQGESMALGWSLVPLYRNSSSYCPMSHPDTSSSPGIYELCT